MKQTQLVRRRGWVDLPLKSESDRARLGIAQGWRYVFLHFFEKKNNQGTLIVARFLKSGAREKDTRAMFNKAKGHAVLYRFNGKRFVAIDQKGDTRLRTRWEEMNSGKVSGPEAGHY